MKYTAVLPMLVSGIGASAGTWSDGFQTEASPESWVLKRRWGKTILEVRDSGLHFEAHARIISDYRVIGSDDWEDYEVSVRVKLLEVVHEEASKGPMIPTTEPLYFGDMGILPGNNPKQQNFEGGLDDFGLWNRALSAAEIQEVFETGLGGILAVSPSGKLAIQWAAVKAAR
jgi:hypothetical protein